VTIRAYCAALSAISAVLLLGGCTAVDAGRPDPSQSSANETDSTKSAPPVETTVAVESVLNVVSVDVDGQHVTASGYVGGTIEEGRTCTFDFVLDDARVSAESQSLADRSTTSCGSVSVPIGSFTRGTWDVSLTYITIDGTEVVSDPTVLEIP
jgi:hypothetical protein